MGRGYGNILLWGRFCWENLVSSGPSLKTLELNALSDGCKGSLFLADLKSLPDVWSIIVDPSHATECVLDLWPLRENQG